MSRRPMIKVLPPALIALAACADKPEVDQIAQMAMIGLAKRDIVACLGEPARRRWVAQGEEIWTYPIGVTITHTPPWGAGLDLAATQGPLPCDVDVVMTNARASQVTYRLPGGLELPTGRQCSFPVQACALRRQLR
jgi:hypothetical protein